MILSFILVSSWWASGVIGIEPGKLGIAWSRDLALTPKDNARLKMGWLGIAQFEDVIEDWSNEELAGLAKSAWKDMETNFKKTPKPWAGIEEIEKFKTFDIPTIMTLIIKGKLLYAASSVRSLKAYRNPPGGAMTGEEKEDRQSAYIGNLHGMVRFALIACQLQSLNKDGTHRREENCGEIMAAHIAMENGLILTDLKGAKVSHRTRSSYCV